MGLFSDKSLGGILQNTTPVGFGLKKLGIKIGDQGYNMPDMQRPDDPTFLGITNPKGQLEQRFSLRQQPRGEFEQRLRQRALMQGPSAETMRQVGQAGQAAQSGYAQSLSNMAQRGGISAGARERLAGAASLQGMRGQQQARAAGEQQKLGLQQGFAGQEAGERAGDVKAQLMDRQMQNQFALDQYRAKLAEYAGIQQGNQQMDLARNTGGIFGGGGILGTGIRF